MISAEMIMLKYGMWVSKMYSGEKTMTFHKDDCDSGDASGMYLLLFWIILLFNPTGGCRWAESSIEKYLGAFLVAAVSLHMND